MIGDQNGGNKEVMQVKGEFSLIREIHGNFPRVGPVNDTIEVNSSWGGNVNLKRLKALSVSNNKTEPLLLLVIAPPGCSNLLDGVFVSLASNADISQVDQLIQFLIHKPFDTITREEAERLLESRNPCEVYLGLARLRCLKLVSADDFGIALRRVSTGNVESVLREMFRTASTDSKSLLGITDKLIVKDTSPEKEVRILEAVLGLLKSNNWSRAKQC